MQVKNASVKFHDMSPQILFAIMVANCLYKEHNVELVITSLNDSGMVHGVRSLHAIGHAVDLRTHTLDLSNVDKQAFSAELWQRLGGPQGQYDVVLEGMGTGQEHLHIEYQPHRAVTEEKSYARDV